MTVQNLEVYEEDGRVLMKATFKMGGHVTRDLTYDAEHDEFGGEVGWLDWAREQLERQKTLRPKRCETCGVWAKTETPKGWERSGECRKHPPEIRDRIESETTTRITFENPLTDFDFWCGEWETPK